MCSYYGCTLFTANIHFLSLEPLLGSLGKLHLEDIEWVIAFFSSSIQRCRSFRKSVLWQQRKNSQ
jgi:protein gp37